MVTANDRVEIFYRGTTTAAEIGYNDLTLNISSGAGRTTCRFTAAGEALQEIGELVHADGVIQVIWGGDTLLFSGKIQGLDFNPLNNLGAVAVETTLGVGKIQSNLKGNLRRILSQPPLKETFVEYPELLGPVLDDLENTPRSENKLIRDCYQHNIIIDNNGSPHNIAEGTRILRLDSQEITSVGFRVVNGRHTPKGIFQDGTRIAGIRVVGAEAAPDKIQNHVYVLGKPPIVFSDNREAGNIAWATLFGREATRTIIRESAELKVTMPLNLNFRPLLVVDYANPTFETLTGIELWTVETVSHRISGSQASTTLQCKVLYENEKWRR